MFSKNSHSRAAPPEEASARLRRRIDRPLLSRAGDAAWLLWLAARTALKGFLLAILWALVAIATGSALLFMVLLLATAAALAAIALMDVRKRFGPLTARRGKGSVLIGRSFRHLTGIGDYGTEAVEVGCDRACSADYLGEPNPHALIVGSTSSGKTTTMRSLIARIALRCGVPFLLIDWNGENEEWARSVNAAVWKVPESFKVSLFRLNGLTREARASLASESLAVAAKLTALQATRVKSALLRCYASEGEPSLFSLWKALCWRNASRANVLDQRLRAVQRAIGTEPEAFWDGVFSRNSVVSLVGLNESEKSLVAHAVLQRLTELFDRERWDGPAPRLLVVMDEAWQMFRREREYDDAAREPAAERIARLGRKYGIGIIVSTQQLDDVPKVFVNSSALLMLHQHRDISYMGRDLLRLGPYEREYMRNAAQGEMLLFDRGMAQKGRWHSEYVKASPLSRAETAALAGLHEQYEPERIGEPEMPIEEYDGTEQERAGEAEARQGAPPAPAKRESSRLARPRARVPEGAPTPTQYAGLLAIRDNPGAGLGRLVSYIRGKGWYTSPTTLYGSKGDPGIIRGLLDSGMARESGRSYGLTPLGLKWVDVDTIMSGQADKLGSEEHRRLMAKTIRILQDGLQLAVVSGEKHSFDVLAIPVNAKKRGLWDPSGAKGYEVQTSAREDSVRENSGKAERWGVPMAWVVHSKEVSDGTRQIERNAELVVL